MLIIAFAGKRRANDALVASLLRALTDGLSYENLVQGSLLEGHQASSNLGWWSNLFSWHRRDAEPEAI